MEKLVAPRQSRSEIPEVMKIINPFAKEILKVETTFCGQPLSLEINRLAFRSQAAVLATYGETVVLATVNVGEVDTGFDYFPLSVDYEERFYAAGKISGSRYIKREGRPSDDAILTGRLIDRPIRPLFPKGYRCPVQVVATVLSLDPQLRPDFLALTAVSAALSLSGAPFAGPVAGVRVAQVDGRLVACPTKEQQQAGPLDIMVASGEKGVMMIEAAAQEVSEETIAAAMQTAHQANQELISLQQQLLDKVEVEPLAYELVLPTEAMKKTTQAWLKDRLQTVLSGDYAQRLAKIKQLKRDFMEYLSSEDLPEDDWSLYDQALEGELDGALRRKIINEEKRLDGRALTEVRPLSSQVGVLPRTHGSALFTRGATQALNIVTLASTSFGQLLDTMERDEEKYYFHHYNAPGYTVGEVKRLGSANRREIGHSYLAEKALLAVLPNETDFPYAIRSVTEIMSQQGSTSMAATCASSLALMDAGVPLKAPVAGVAMGLILKDERTPLFLTDIADAEDFAGDMDFKVAGTAEGITAMQMDMKVDGLPVSILEQGLKAARQGRLNILEHMLGVLDKPRPDLSRFAPRVVCLQIPVHAIKDLIGKGGETIHSLTADTGAQIDIKDDGRVFVFCNDKASLDSAIGQIKELTDEPEVGLTYHDKPVVKVMDFGMFVNLKPGCDGMVHVSELSNRHVKHPGDLFKEGDKVSVKLIAIDDQGRLSLSIKQAAKQNGK